MDYSTKLPLNIKLRLVILLIQNTATTSILPFMSLLLADLLGKTSAGLILIIGLILKFIFTILGGYYTDKVKSKKLFITISTLISAIIFFLMAINLILLNNSIKYSLFIFIILYLLNEIFNNISKPSYNALALENITDNIRLRYSKVKYWILNLSMTLGMVIGGVFYTNFKIELFFFIFLSLILNIFILNFFITEEINIKNQYRKSNFKLDLLLSYKEASKNTKYLLLVVASALILSAEVSLSVYGAVRLENSFHIIYIGKQFIDGVRVYSLLNIINTIIVLLLNFYIFKLFQNIKDISLLKLGIFIFALGYSVLMFTESFLLLIIAMTVATIGEILFSPVLESEKIKLIPSDQRGSHSALDAFSATGAELISRLVLIISTSLSPIGIGFLTFSISISGLLLILFIHSKHNRNI
ncbi:MFS transporter [Staphylococcus gallinarum]|uniref:MFS transporter n=1 Tax=Staphylococcus gallinarum TaxID=1293 RepID=UPI000D1E309C|nr:MFS transporter [Staphylococcus gallinarum]PTK90486.1 MFS transporter [Staphylococcus gallinarum]